VPIDPVCGAEIDEDDLRWSSVYKGITYIFCSEACKEDFDSDPELFVWEPGEYEEDDYAA
jgi:Cu+-exporting ATPase